MHARNTPPHASGSAKRRSFVVFVGWVFLVVTTILSHAARPSNCDYGSDNGSSRRGVPALKKLVHTLLNRSRGLNGFDGHAPSRPLRQLRLLRRFNPSGVSSIYRGKTPLPQLATCSFLASSRPDIPGIWTIR